MTVTERDRKATYRRDDNECVLARLGHRFEPCSGILTVQHRVGKGMGGSKLFDTVPFLVAMCNGHNTLAETSAEFAEYCRRNGYSLPRNRRPAINPCEVPVRYWDGPYLLDAHGGRERISEVNAIELWTVFGLRQPIQLHEGVAR